MIDICIEKNENIYLYDFSVLKNGGKKNLSVLIDKDGGIQSKEIESFSRMLNELIDKEESDFDNIEVSSPGVERVMTKMWHYEKAIGKEIRIKLYKKIDDSKTVEGKLTGIDGDYIMINEKKIDIKDIAKANVIFNMK